MNFRFFRLIILVSLCCTFGGRGLCDTPAAPDALVLANGAIRLVVQRDGGLITELALEPDGPNWLATRAPGAAGPYAHFLCYDRWGPPDEAAKRQGIPFHGEAARTPWTWQSATTKQLDMTVRLPVSGLGARRSMQLAAKSPVFRITNTFINPTAQVRSYNAVEHVMLAIQATGPDTHVATNADRGFLQRNGRVVPNSEFAWPRAHFGDRTWDFRNEVLINGRVMAALVFPENEDWGWVCISNQVTGEALGYVWRQADYPWLILWADCQKGRIVSRAIEPGTTGLHRPMPEVVAAGSKLGRPLLCHLEPGEMRRHQMWGFLVQLPAGSTAVDDVKSEGNMLQIQFNAGVEPLNLPLN
ncbi:MAG: hypothetical protein K9M98_13570 [Cephaloticoccus sp.]|nr:hypothetical protein [Cephaloticoccus sp.]MCF7761522.1 hypothetical protein [Cephaloticoccus sp.]